jgi:hypothetical protein
MVEHLPSKCKPLSSNPHTTKKKKKSQCKYCLDPALSNVNPMGRGRPACYLGPFRFHSIHEPLPEVSALPATVLWGPASLHWAHYTALQLCCPLSYSVLGGQVTWEADPSTKFCPFSGVELHTGPKTDLQRNWTHLAFTWAIGSLAHRGKSWPWWLRHKERQCEFNQGKVRGE